MDPTLRLVSWQASPVRDGRGRGQAVPELVGGAGPRRRVDAEPGAERLLFLYRAVLGQDLPWLDDVVRAKRTSRLPVVLTRDEVRAVIRQLRGAHRLMAILLYGAGLRLLECARLRVKDLDFGRKQIIVRAGKGDKDRATSLPAK